ncbi:hypothetical protein GII30_00690 [Gordonia amarae]|uniref:Secreted protein n=2 Tax=Gordonia amarae TaxID=36821 RepID=G7GV37_9ACTN|nr:hypothetical protein [Gordonia amarae]MCS3876859.1 hypothetical protein [Gordonia amarae]QHN15693.1 hypothetical protein GII35_00690 [Gordonia amarae]QHN20262.1 hypothetical protein GII34_00690 [Gordonia amarae]QHN29113.1 hypothetical protein GII32_00690 [Gordonia amarae]QHN37893.1 hypothetical protein GII30_00690 [Gordonia amarae]
MNITKTTAAATMLAAAGAVALGVVAGPANAAIYSNNPIDVPQCSYATGTPSQECLNTPTYRVTTSTGKMVVQFRANYNHCSDIIAHIIVDGREWGSQRVGPGQKDGSYYMQLTPGTHKVGVRATGIRGGCNVGYVSAWGGNLRIETNADADNGIG